MELRMCRGAATLILTLAFFFQTEALAQRNVQKTQSKREVTSQDLGYQGNYHVVKSQNLSPIEKLMRKADFCQIDNYGYYMIIPNCASELDEDGEMPTDEITSEKVKFLLKRDVVRYLDMEEEYDTPLKQKRFKESEDYGYLKSCLENDRECFLNHSYYIVFDMDAQYNLNSHTFTVPFAGNIAGSMSVVTNDTHFDGSDFVTPPIDEDLAYRIETSTTELIIFVKFTGGIDSYDLLECKPLKVCITDKNTGKIYFEYTPSETANKDDLISQNREEKAEEETVIEVTETMSEYPGGDRALLKFLSDNMRYPKKAQEEGVQGRVVIYFDVDVDGIAKNPEIIRSLSPECDLEAVRLVSIMPKWKPATRNGEPVKVRYTLPLTFRMQ